AASGGGLYRCGSELQSVDKPAPHQTIESSGRTESPCERRLAKVPQLRTRTTVPSLFANRSINVSVREWRRTIYGRLESRSRWFRQELSSNLARGRVAASPVPLSHIVSAASV